jgi:hypothetical protein
MHSSSYIPGASSGSFYVDSEWTQLNAFNWWGGGPAWGQGSANGDSVASMVLGYMNSGNGGSIFAAANQYFSYPYFAPFFQDDWKINNKLTVNLGVRWDLQGPPSEANNKIVGDFNTTAVNPVQSQIPTGMLPAGVTLLGGNTYAGVNGQPRTIFAWDLLALQPRLGFAYSLDNKTVILFGIGLFRGGQQRIDLLLQARLGFVHALVAHCLVLARVRLDLFPSMDTWPSFTSPASEHSSRACVNRPESASRWRLRNSAIVAWLGCWSPER